MTSPNDLDREIYKEIEVRLNQYRDERAKLAEAQTRIVELDKLIADGERMQDQLFPEVKAEKESARKAAEEKVENLKLKKPSAK